MRTWLILNDPPYGTERSYNALRLADPLAQQERPSFTLQLATSSTTTPPCSRAR